MTFKFHIVAHDVGGRSYDPVDGSGHYDPELEYHILAHRDGSSFEYKLTYWSRVAAELALSNIVDAKLHPDTHPNSWHKVTVVRTVQ